MLLERGRNVGALVEAARWGDLALVQQLVARGIPVDATEEDGVSALICAASAGEVEIIDYLIDHGANVNATSCRYGRTPLMALLAALHDSDTYCQVAKRLLEAGARVDITDHAGKNAIDYAEERGDPRVAELLRATS